VAINPSTNTIYAVNRGGSISVIDGSTNTVVRTFRDRRLDQPVGIAVNPSTNMVYITSLRGGAVLAIDAGSGAVSASIPAGSKPYPVAVDSQRNLVYTGNYGDGTVSVIDGSTNAVVATIGGVTQPQGIAVDAAANAIYVAGRDGTVSRIDGATRMLTGVIATGVSGAEGIALDSAANVAYVAAAGANKVYVLPLTPGGGKLANGALVRPAHTPNGVAADAALDAARLRLRHRDRRPALTDGRPC
jgi:YVTN family beta-propeller protein